MTTASDASSAPDLESRILEIVKQFWGYESLRPLQAEAIRAGMEQRDSLVVLPTGGGKSMCYQAPPVLADRTDIVISPLISLMKDQVDGLRACGYPAAAIHSQLSHEEIAEVRTGVANGQFRLLFVAPERLVTTAYLELFERINVRSFAIDEAHCISHWGHDFRPEYRRLSVLKRRFPNASVHAYTATATEQVRSDIVQQLGLVNPTVLVGGFDRPNLVYRIVPAVDVHAQVIEVLRRHPNEACIAYCLSRKDTESLAATLNANGFKAEPYHAGLEREQRRRTQEAFAHEEIDVVTATVAFGMGIDRSNVRCVIHATMPKSIEHYQQETGRAGRDGLEAECVLLYSAAAPLRWKQLISMSAEESSQSQEIIEAQFRVLNQMQGFCTTAQCRHRALVRHFGQEYEQDDCGACDFCLGEVDSMKDSTATAQKILSCVARLNQQFGVGYVVQILRGADTEQIRYRGHPDLSTYGLLREIPEKSLTNIVYQLIDQGVLSRTEDDRPVLHLNEESMAVLRGEREVHLIEPPARPVRKTKQAEASWEGVDHGLFDRLRDVRKSIADERGVPAYVVFGDETLRGMARVRPGSLDQLLAVKGVGERKLADFGAAFLEAITTHCREHDLEMNNHGRDDIVR